MAKWILASLTTVAAAAALVLLFQNRRLHSDFAALQSESATHRQSAAERIKNLETQIFDLRSQPVEPHTDDRPAPAPPPKVAVDDPVTRQELVRLLNEKNEKLAQLEVALSELRDKLQQVESRAGTLQGDVERSAAALHDSQLRIDAAVQQAEAAQAETRVRDARIAQLENANQELRRRADDASRKADRAVRSTDQLDDIARRQDAFLNNILRRYREVADLYRTISLRIDSNSELSRIQSAITAADEDLRQLRALQAQAARLQKELATRK